MPGLSFSGSPSSNAGSGDVHQTVTQHFGGAASPFAKSAIPQWVWIAGASLAVLIALPLVRRAFKG